MPLWKPLFVIVPAGLALGMIGGNLAKPEMVGRATSNPLQAIIQTRAGREGGSTESLAQPQGDLAYVGGYSYPPGFATQDAGWTPPMEDRLAYSEIPLPTVAQLDERQAALLADPEVEFAVHRPGEDADVVEGGTQLASAIREEAGPEPRKADGEPAIW